LEVENARYILLEKSQILRKTVIFVFLKTCLFSWIRAMVEIALGITEFLAPGLA